MSQPIPEGREGFKTGQQRLREHYIDFKWTVDENDFKCPKEEREEELLHFVSLDYCESFSKGEGCKHRCQCRPYLNAKKKTSGGAKWTKRYG